MLSSIAPTNDVWFYLFFELFDIQCSSQKRYTLRAKMNISKPHKEFWSFSEFEPQNRPQMVWFLCRNYNKRQQKDFSIKFSFPFIHKSNTLWVGVPISSVRSSLFYDYFSYNLLKIQYSLEKTLHIE